ncbi:glucokinase [uncultured Tateyamaria sp.]|uniref:glucokinase n=1 Tax=uncultured Tateyamaria sp. TaxID=455651 RepID=UPI002635835B|nr:glucokinase [uncultured Tateyamaria sp.]
MLYLVADVGGTNCRLALADEGGVRAETVQRFRNENYAGFADVARAYMADHPPLTAAAVAIAGPVGKGEGRLTNRDWHFDAATLAQELSLEAVYLLNDLEAHGHAICVLSGPSLHHLSGTPVEDEPQAMVVGLGTGFNVAVAHRPSGVVFAAEMGHARVPQSVATIVSEAVKDPSEFATVEHLLAGRGFANLHRARTGVTCKPEDVGTSEGGQQTIEVAARALGALVRELAYIYLPEGGIFFNGSLAKTLIQSPYGDMTLAPLLADDRFGDRMPRIPTYLMTDDASALHGCARYLAVSQPG